MSDVREPRKPEVLIADPGGGVAVVSLLGEHDITTADGLRNSLTPLVKRGADVVVDLTEAEFVDCSVMHVLEDTQRSAWRYGARVSFQLGTSRLVRRVFELVGALEAWPVFETRADAIEAFGGAPPLASIW